MKYYTISVIHTNEISADESNISFVVFQKLKMVNIGKQIYHFTTQYCYFTLKTF